MKRNAIKLICLITLFVLLGMSVSAVTGTYNNYSNPRTITLPANKGCGNNTVGLYIDESITNYGASLYTKYKWQQLTGSSDVLAACNAAHFYVTNQLFLTTTGAEPLAAQKTDNFYGSAMTPSTYRAIGSISTTSNTLSISASYTCITTVKNPYDQSIIASDTFTNDLP